MKALTDKIIERLQSECVVIGEPADPEGLKAYNNGIEFAIRIIRDEEAWADFEEIARIMMKHLANPEKYHPHHRVIIDSTNAELLEGKKSTGQIMDYIPE